MRHWLPWIAAFAAALAGFTRSAHAASSSAFMKVTVQVVPNCRVAVTDMAFGTYDPLVANATQELDATAEVRMLCTRDAQVTIIFDAGHNGGFSKRAMAMASERVDYDLFRDAARTLRWADGANALHAKSTGGRDPQLFKVFGRVPAGQEVPPGAYYDVVTATMDF